MPSLYTYNVISSKVKKFGEKRVGWVGVGGKAGLLFPSSVDVKSTWKYKANLHSPAHLQGSVLMYRGPLDLQPENLRVPEGCVQAFCVLQLPRLFHNPPHSDGV